MEVMHRTGYGEKGRGASVPILGVPPLQHRDCSAPQKLSESQCSRVFIKFNLQFPHPVPRGQWVGLRLPTLESLGLSGDQPPS